MPVFSTLSEIDDYIVNVTLEEMATPTKIATEEKLNYRVEENLYRDVVINDDFYINTFSLLNSAESYAERYGTGIINTGLLVSTWVKPYAEYNSFYGGQSQKDNIVDYLNNGHKGFYKSLTIDYEGKHFFEDATKDLSKGSFLKKTVSDYLKALGYVIGRRGKD